jgi:hypothetical protein
MEVEGGTHSKSFSNDGPLPGEDKNSVRVFPGRRRGRMRVVYEKEGKKRRMDAAG